MGILSVAFSGDSKLLASGGWDNKVRVYRMDSPQTYTMDDAKDVVYSVAFSADSKLLASGSRDKVRVYALEDGTAPSLKSTLDDATNYASVAFSADSKLLASGSRADSKVRVYYGLNSSSAAAAALPAGSLVV